MKHIKERTTDTIPARAGCVTKTRECVTPKKYLIYAIKYIDNILYMRYIINILYMRYITHLITGGNYIMNCTLNNARKISGLHFTTQHNGKMSGMVSISTSVTTNERCKKNAAIKGSICEQCFAAKQMRVFTSMEKPMVENQRILTSQVLPLDMLPTINNLYFRFEAFGDLNNATQVKNYFNLCYKNPRVKFALWTKNPDYIAEAIADGYEKPDNLNIVLSSLFINQERKNPFPFVDKVFTVYDPAYIEENNVPINCGARNCFDCGLCYEKNGVGVINEKLK